MKGLVVVGMLIVAACGPSATPVPTAAPSPTAEAYTITGTFTLSSAGLAGVNSCSGTGGFSDIAEGLGVTVSDESHKIIAKGALGPGKLKGQVTCNFTFSVTGVPRATFYSIEVGHRGELTYSFDEMVSKGWQVAFELG